MTNPAAAFIFKASLDWTQARIVEKLPPEEYQRLRASLPEGRLPEDQSHIYASEWVCDMEEAVAWDKAGVSLTIGKIRGVAYPVKPSSAVADALAGAGGPTIINVSVAGAGLYAVQSVHYEEDCCTMHLQSLLDLGWRILAVCPPNDTRRPTYILGHHVAGMKP